MALAAIDWTVAAPILGVAIPGIIGLLGYALASRERHARIDIEHIAADTASLGVRSQVANDAADRLNDLLANQAEELERERRHRREDADRHAAEVADLREAVARERAWKHEARNNAMLANGYQHNAELDRDTARAERDRYLARLVEAGLADRPEEDDGR